MRDAFAAAPGEPVAGFGDCLLFFLALRFIIDGRVAQSGGHRIDDRFQQPNQGRELCLRQTVNQLVGVLAVAHLVFSLAAAAAEPDDHLRASWVSTKPSSTDLTTFFSSSLKREMASNCKRRSSSGPRSVFSKRSSS